MTRPVLVFALLALLGPLAAPSAAARKATSVVAFEEGDPDQPIVVGSFRETVGRLRMHLIVGNRVELEEVSLSIAAGRCGAPAGRALSVDLGTVPKGGDNITASVATGLKELGLPNARSVRLVSAGEVVGCARPLSLRKGKRPTVTVSDLRPVGGSGVRGLAITRQRGGRMLHAIAVTDRAPRAASLNFEEIKCTVVSRSGATLHEVSEFPNATAATRWSIGATAAATTVAPRARTVNIMGDDDLVATARARRYAVAG
jgi:orotate phosphoribosyltransferase